MAELPPYPGTPRWVTVSGIIAIVATLLFAALQLTGVIGRHGPGRHGPGRHAPLGGGGGESPSSIPGGHASGGSDMHMPRRGGR